MAANIKATKEVTYSWEGKDKKGRSVKGEIRATGESFVNATLRRQGIVVTKVKNKAASRIKVAFQIKTLRFLLANLLP